LQWFNSFDENIPDLIMPFSSPTFDKLFTEHLSSIQPKSVLDVGAGAGKYGRIIKEVLPNCRIEAIEPTQEYVEKYWLPEIYQAVYRSSVEMFCRDNASARHDIVIFGDVLEHFFRSQAIDYLDYFLYRSEWVFAIWPNMMPQDDWEGNKYEIHKSNFTLADLSSRFDIHAYRKVFGWFHWNDPEMTHCWYNFAVIRGYVTKRNVSL